jgi:hypothetical protein
LVRLGTRFAAKGQEAVTLSAVHAERLLGLTMTVAYTNSELIEDLVLGAVLAILGYLASERYKRARGVTPWRLPSALWALLLFFLTLLGAVLYMIAYFTTRPRRSPSGTGAPGQGWGSPPPGWNAPPSSWTPGPPQGFEAPAPPRSDAPAPGYGQVAPGSFGPAPPPGGWDAPPPPGTVFPGLGESGPPGAPVLPPAPAPSPRTWLPDPGGRHELRYWDGIKFTEHVADGGKISVDPL